MTRKSANRFASFRDESAHEYPTPTAVPATAASVPEQGIPTAVPATAASVPEQGIPTARADDLSRPRERVLSDKIAFSSRISPGQSRTLAELVRETGKPQTRLLEEALALLFEHYKKA